MKSYMDNRYAALNGTIIEYDGKDRTLMIPGLLGNMPVQTIGGYAFSDAQAEIIRIPKTVSRIGSDAFVRCSQLHTLYLPSGAEIPMNPFRQCDALRTIIFDGITLDKKEADVLYAASTDVGDGVYMTQHFPNHPMFTGLRQHGPLREPKGFVPDGAQLFYCRDENASEAELCRFGTQNPPGEEDILRRLIATKETTFLDTFSEAQNDTAERENRTKPIDDTAFLFYRRGSESGKISGRIQIGRYFWQSLIPVAAQGRHYFIYRRCYLMKDKTLKYSSAFVGVYDSDGSRVSKEKEESVYGKYKLMSVL